MITARRLFLGFGTLTALLVACCLTIWMRILTVDRGVEELARVARERSRVAQQLQVHVFGHALALQSWRRTGEERFLQTMDQEAQAVAQGLSRYGDLARTDRQEALVRSVEDAWRGLESIAAGLDKPGPPPDPEDLQLEERRSLLEELLGQVSTEAMDTYRAHTESVRRDLRRTASLVLVLMAGGSALAAITSVGVGRRVLRDARALEDQMRLIDLTDPIVLRDPLDQIVVWNAGAERLYGYSRAEAVGRPAQSLLRTELPEPDAEIRKELEATGRWTGNVVRRRKDGERVVVLARWAVDRDGTVLESDTDLTDRQRAEEALGERERELRSMADATPDGLARYDAGLRHVFVNAAMERFLGRDGRSVLGHKPCELDLQQPLCDALEDGVRRVFATGRPESLVSEMIGAQGPRWIDMRLVPERSEAGQIEWVLAVSRDITEAQRVAEELARARQAAEDANAAKDHFLSVLSHELRTPLTPVLILVALWERRPDLPPDLRREVAMLRRNVDLEVRLIDDMLDLSRIARGKVELRSELVDVREEVQHAVGTVGAHAAAKRITLTVEPSGGDAVVFADAARVQQILWNLLSNAVKFTPDGGVVTVWAEVADDRVRVVVRDTGVGIEPESRHKIFQAFEQGSVEVTRRFGGLGLGLPISRALAEMHGGTLTASSGGAGCGATFVLELPRASRAGTDERRPEAERSPSAATRRGLRVLVVEDHADTADLLVQLLRVLGHEPRVARTVAEALVAAREESFDLLVSDLGLPDGTGHDVMRALMAAGRTPGIAISGFGTEEDVRRSEDAGFAAHLTKPVHIDELSSAIEGVLS